MTPLLKLDGVTAFYGASQALFGVDLEVGEGEVVALMGRNGMGKTTTVRTICALLRPREGAITFDGAADPRPRDPPHRPPRHRPRARGPALLRAADRRGEPDRRRPPRRLDAGPRRARSSRASRERRAQTASTLSGGEQQMLAIGRALMTNPRLLILDEATEGLAPVVRQEIWAAIHELKGSGLSILVIDKTLKELARRRRPLLHPRARPHRLDRRPRRR